MAISTLFHVLPYSDRTESGRDTRSLWACSPRSERKKCSLDKAMTLCGVARNTLRDFIGLCEMKILDKVKYKSIIEQEKGCTRQPSVKTIEMRCRAALSEYKTQSRRYKEGGKLLPFYPTDSFYSN